MFATARIEAQLRETRDMAVRAATKIDEHANSCVEHNRRVEDILTTSAAKREEQHAENQRIMAETRESIASVKGWMLMLVVSGLGTIVIGLAGALYVIFAHGLLK